MNADHVIDRLQSADRAWQKQRATVLVLRHWKWLVLAVAALIVADVVLHLDGRQRLTAGLLVVGAAVVASAWVLNFAFKQTNPMERIARLLESRAPELGSKLINLLHLREQFIAQPHPSALTRSLAEQAVNDAADDVGTISFSPLTQEREIKRLYWHATIPSLLFVVLGAVFFVPFVTTLVRYIDPFGDHPPYSLTRLWIEEPGNEASVLYGGSFMVKARWAGHDPKELFLTAQPAGKPEAAFTVPMMPIEPGLFAQQLENVRTDLVMRVHTKGSWSVSTERRLAVVLTPQFESALIAITPPDYTGLAEKTMPFTFSGATALRGSRVTLTLRSNRPLKEARLHLATTSGEPRDITLKPSTPEPSAQEVSASFVAEASGRMSFSLLASDGIPSDAVKTCAFTVTHDLPPTVTIAEPARDGFLVEGYAMNARVAATDDYSLRTVRVHLLRFDKALPLIERSYQTITLSDSIDISLSDRYSPPLHSGDVVSFFAEAIDNHPSPPHVTRSEVRTLQVISRMEYNDFLREEHGIADLEAKYEALFQDFQKLVDQQKALADDAAKLDQKLAEKPDDAALQKQREAQKQAQAKLNDELRKFADGMDKFVSDMPLYDVEKDFQEQLSAQANEVRESVAQNEQEMKGADGKSMAGAAKKHHERMAGEQRETEKNIEKAIADAAELQEMMNDFSRFESLFHQQEQLTQQMNAYREKAVLDATDQLAVQSLGSTQREVGDELRDLRSKLVADALLNAEKFPKASASCQKLADAISDRRMEPLATVAAGKMMKADGKGGYDSADRLREEMASLFGECKGGQQNASDELDTCLSLSHCNKPGGTAAQMAMSRKFGKGRGFASQGAGMGGFQSGNVPQGGASVYGMESKLGRVSKGAGDGDATPTANATAPAVITGSAVNSDPAQVNRASDAMPAATMLDQYRSLTDAYFDRITGKKKDEPKQP